MNSKTEIASETGEEKLGDEEDVTNEKEDVDSNDGDDDDDEDKDDDEVYGDDDDSDLLADDDEDVVRTSTKRKRSKVDDEEDDDEDDDQTLIAKKSKDDGADDAGDDDDDAGDEDENVGDEDNDGDGNLGNAGWADAMAKILASDKAILSKAKKDKDVVLNKKKKPTELEVVDDEGKTTTLPTDEENKKETEPKEKDKKKPTVKENNYGRTKPHLLEKQFERSLQRIATRGVIQLFNAVNTHQKDVKDKIRSQGKSVFKRDAVVKSVTKGDFIDLLKAGTTKKTTSTSDRVTVATPTVSTKLPVSESTWKILRDDFMMTKGKTMKDWDKESDSGED